MSLLCLFDFYRRFYMIGRADIGELFCEKSF